MSKLLLKVICLNSFKRLPIIGRKVYTKCLRKNYSGMPSNFMSFDEMTESRRAQARRSIIVQVNSEASFDELYNYCSKFGDIIGIHHYVLSKDNQNFMLVEFKQEDNLSSLMLSGCSHRNESDAMPINTPYVWFRNSGKKYKKYQVKNESLKSINGCVALDNEQLMEKLKHCTSISEQISLLYDNTVLNDLGVRLRYMVARQVELAFLSLYANIAVRPFGSSVNGFGRMGCDLDLIVNNYTDEVNENRLVFHSKKSANAGGSRQWQRHMELMGDIIQVYLPGCSNVRRILQARVPIIKFNQHFTGIECDLTMLNMSGVYMSELLYLYGSMDSRVRPLVFIIRKWAQNVGLTNSSPGRWITNFPLTLMVIFFLQQKTRDGAILPPLKYLVKNAEKKDIRITEDQINCTFARDLNNIQLEEYQRNKLDLETLLFQFFEFYAQFDFREFAISINEGVSIRKTNHTALYIVNPLEQHLNVSRNVSFEECERLKVEVRNAAWHLESNLDEKSSNSKDWGLLKILNQSSNSIKGLLKVGSSQRLVSVADLYKDDVDNEVVDFNNVQVENEVRKIKQEKRLFNERTDRDFSLNKR